MDRSKHDGMLAAKTPSTEIAPQQTPLLRSVIAYDPTPTQRPKVDNKFGEMSAVESTVEVFRYSAFLLEYTLSPNGWLRAWLLLWCRLFLLLAVPTLATSLVIRLAVPMATNAAKLAIQTEIAARVAVVALGWLALSVGLIATVITVVKRLMQGRQGRLGR